MVVKRGTVSPSRDFASITENKERGLSAVVGALLRKVIPLRHGADLIAFHLAHGKAALDQLIARA
jgi:hypothetical protein